MPLADASRAASSPRTCVSGVEKVAPAATRAPCTGARAAAREPDLLRHERVLRKGGRRDAGGVDRLASVSPPTRAGRAAGAADGGRWARSTRRALSRPPLYGLVARR